MKTDPKPYLVRLRGLGADPPSEGHQFEFWSGHRPRLWVWSPVGVHRRGNQSMFLCLSFSLPSPLSKINKIFN